MTHYLKYDLLIKLFYYVKIFLIDDLLNELSN